MSRLRDHKRRARRDLHREMSVPAFYINGNAAPLLVTVRIHTSEADGGNTDDRYGEAVRRDIAPRAIFNVPEMADALNVSATSWFPARGAKLSVEAGEAYTIGDSKPRDGEFITASIARLSGSALNGLPVP